jgi:hypothetical protein
MYRERWWIDGLRKDGGYELSKDGGYELRKDGGYELRKDGGYELRKDGGNVRTIISIKKKKN